MPMPVSAITRVSPWVKMRILPAAVYFRALERICSITKQSHFSSVSTCRAVPSYSRRILFRINCFAYFRTHWRMMSSSAQVLNTKSVLSLSRRR